jgi:sterol desaturase/sphingolipid hydroxylase (fatty acid hydroxylase superfamily)
MVQLAPGEAPKLAAIVALMLAITHVRRKEMRKRWLGAGQPQGLQDHPAVPYLIENCTLIAAAFVAERLFPRPDRTRPIREVLFFVLKGILVVDLPVAFEKLLCAVLYEHVPYFAERKPPEDLGTVLKDFATTNVPDTLANSLIQVAILLSIPDQMYAKTRNPAPIRIVPFIGKYLLGRMLVDVSFGLLHYAMHANAAVYQYVHKRHHEHTAPRSQTNYHFERVDLFLEGVAPLYAALGGMYLLGCEPNLNEQAVMFASYIYYESCSHSGKEMPCVTWFPLLSPLVGWLTGSDDRLVEYHTRHHQLYNCNYSISPWPDKLCGTYRIDLPDVYRSASADSNPELPGAQTL